MIISRRRNDTKRTPRKSLQVRSWAQRKGQLRCAPWLARPPSDNDCCAFFFLVLRSIPCSIAFRKLLKKGSNPGYLSQSRRSRVCNQPEGLDVIKPTENYIQALARLMPSTAAPWLHTARKRVDDIPIRLRRLWLRKGPIQRDNRLFLVLFFANAKSYIVPYDTVIFCGNAAKWYYIRHKLRGAQYNSRSEYNWAKPNKTRRRRI